MGVDSESKGLWIYWPGKNHVSIERDVYFNEKDIYKFQLRGKVIYSPIPTFPSLPPALNLSKTQKSTQ